MSCAQGVSAGALASRHAYHLIPWFAPNNPYVARIPHEPRRESTCLSSFGMDGINYFCESIWTLLGLIIFNVDKYAAVFVSERKFVLN